MSGIPRIGSMMTPFAFTVSADAPIAQAREFLRRKEIHHLPVIHDDMLVGALTDRDINLVLGPDFAYPPESELTVREVMRKRAYAVSPDTPIDAVLDHMASNHLGSAFVVEDGEVVGVFTAVDAHRAFAAFLRDTCTTIESA